MPRLELDGTPLNSSASAAAAAAVSRSQGGEKGSGRAMDDALTLGLKAVREIAVRA